MLQIIETTSDALQNITLTGENNEVIFLTLNYKPTQEAWYFDISYGDFICNGMKLCNFPNLLRQWKNILPFGLACTVSDGFEPYYIDDFTTGRVIIYLLNADDVLLVETKVFLQ